MKEFVNMVSVLDQNPGTQWQALIGSVNPEEDIDLDGNGMVEEGDDDGLVSFKL